VDEPDALVIKSHALMRELASLLATCEPPNHPRPIIASAVARVGLEHGTSIIGLASFNAVTSMVALLRVQYECVIRALWITYAAGDGWVDRVAETVARRSLQEPNNTPAMGEMLDKLDLKAPPEVSRMARQLKDGAWSALNSYIHSGMQPLMQNLHGYPPMYREQTVLNANGLSTMAAMTIAVCAMDPDTARGIREIQLESLDVLPPLAPTSAPSKED
jgi:hypothetical protein